MVKIALLGRDIGYTKSPAVHKAISTALGIDVDFSCCDIPYDKLGDAVNALCKERYVGFFVTKPYKVDIKRFFDCALQSVNLVRLTDKTAYNTDGIGFIRALDSRFRDWRKNVDAALVLGTGGAAHSVVRALQEQNKKVYVLGRSNKNALGLIAQNKGAQLYTNQPAQLVVNCTPLGWHGEDALSSFCVRPAFDYAFDLVYDTDTPFINKCRKGGAHVADGADMLIYQAIEGDKILLNSDRDVQRVFEQASKTLLSEGVFRCLS